MSLALKERELRLLPLRSLHGMGPQKSVLSTDNINDSCHDASELVENHVFLEENFPQNREYFFSRENENDPFLEMHLRQVGVLNMIWLQWCWPTPTLLLAQHEETVAKYVHTLAYTRVHVHKTKKEPVE